MNTHELADEVFDLLFENTNNQTINFLKQFPYAEVNRGFSYIKLNDEFVIKIERI